MPLDQLEYSPSNLIITVVKTHPCPWTSPCVRKSLPRLCATHGMVNSHLLWFDLQRSRGRSHRPRRSKPFSRTPHGLQRVEDPVPLRKRCSPADHSYLHRVLHGSALNHAVDEELPCEMRTERVSRYRPHRATEGSSAAGEEMM